MRLDDLRESENVEDRRGGFGRPLMIGGGGLGIVGVVIALLLGVNPAQLLGGGDVSQPAESQGGFQPQGRADDPLVRFSAKILGSTEDVWGAEFQKRGLRYQPAVFAPYDEATQTGCGGGQAAIGFFYFTAYNVIY